MLDQTTIKNIIESPISVEDYLVLKLIFDNETYLYPKFNQKFKSSIEKLQFEGYLDYSTTLDTKGGYFSAKKDIATTFILQKGKNILNQIENIPTSVKVVEKVDKYQVLYLSLKSELKKLTGKEQVKANIAYPFLCNQIDLESRLSKVVHKYKLTDWEKIEKCLINHIKRSYKQNFMKCQLMMYYIEKGGSSMLVSDYESFTEKDVIKIHTNDDSINI